MKKNSYNKIFDLIGAAHEWIIQKLEKLLIFKERMIM
jgi:hypothetical protein